MNLRGMFAGAAMAIGSITAIGCALPAAAEQASEDSAEKATTADATNGFVFFRSWFAPAPIRARAAINFPTVRYTAPVSKVRYAAPSPYFRIGYAPPAARYETIPRAPSAKHFFVRGHWQFNGQRYVWIGGHWEGKRAGQVYVAAHYNRVNGHYVFVPGHFRNN